MIPRLSTAIDDAMEAVRSLLRITDPVNRLIRESPRPLIHPDARMIVLFSPKSACTSVAAWFFHQLGEAERARAFPSPHRYRIEVYYKSKLYRRAVNLDLNRFRVVRIVRDPIDRAVSSFRHVQRSGIADQIFEAHLGLSDVASKGVSFRQFIDLLERLDLTDCNEHFRIQRHPVEDKLPVAHLINISTHDLFTRLNEAERDLGLPVTDFDRFDWLRSLAARRGRWNSRLDAAEAYEMPLTRSQARRGPWPHYSALLPPAAQERLARLYAVDVAAYGLAPVRKASEVREVHKDPPRPAEIRAFRQERRQRELQHGRRRQRKLKRTDSRG